MLVIYLLHFICSWFQMDFTLGTMYEALLFLFSAQRSSSWRGLLWPVDIILTNGIVKDWLWWWCVKICDEWHSDCVYNGKISCQSLICNSLFVQKCPRLSNSVQQHSKNCRKKTTKIEGDKSRKAAKFWNFFLNFIYVCKLILNNEEDMTALEVLRNKL